MGLPEPLARNGVRRLMRNRCVLDESLPYTRFVTRDQQQVLLFELELLDQAQTHQRQREDAGDRQLAGAQYAQPRIEHLRIGHAAKR